jgi:hypothetical protein
MRSFHSYGKNSFFRVKSEAIKFRYPSTVITNNNTNYFKAVNNMGGDDINTKVWWEK